MGSDQCRLVILGEIAVGPFMEALYAGNWA